MGVVGFAPVIAADVLEPSLAKRVVERFVVENIVVNVVEIILAAEKRAHDQIEILSRRVDLAELCEIRHGSAENPARFEHATPFAQNRDNLASFEMFENMTVVNHIDAVGRDKREVVDPAHVVDMIVFDRINVNIAGNESFPTTQVKLHTARGIGARRSPVKHFAKGPRCTKA